MDTKRPIKKNMVISIRIKKLVFAALCLALSNVLPLLTGNVPNLNSMISPMHIPVLLCGFVCGGMYGGIVGILAPIIKSLTTVYPPLIPNGIAMAFELGAYGLLTGLFYKIFPKKIPYIYISLVSAMLAGRVIWGIASAILYSTGDNPFTMTMFLSGAFINAIPAIICHVILIPIIIIGLRKAGFISNE